MINYINLLFEAYQDNAVDFERIFYNKKITLSLKKEMLTAMYLEWFISKAQIVERDLFINSETFFKKCYENIVPLMTVLKTEKKDKKILLGFAFMMIPLAEIQLMETAPEKHGYPVIDKDIFSDTDWIYNTFVNKVFTGSKECFDAWLVNGYTHPERLIWTLTSRQNKPNYAQLRLFVDIITNTDTCKDAYFKKVWGIEFKTAHNKPSDAFDEKLKELDHYNKPKK